MFDSDFNCKDSRLVGDVDSGFEGGLCFLMRVVRLFLSLLIKVLLLQANNHAKSNRDRGNLGSIGNFRFEISHQTFFHLFDPKKSNTTHLTPHIADIRYTNLIYVSDND